MFLSAMTYPLLDFGGTGPTILLAPANGFPPGSYAGLLEPLTDRFRVVCLPPRAMWPDAGPPPEEPGSWDTLADELLEGMAQHDLANVIGIGHSFGSVALLVAAVRGPGRFQALCLLDPTIPPPSLLERMQDRQDVAWRRSMMLADKARRRRTEFRDRDEAFHYWREKPLFADWSDQALWLYTHTILKPSEQGDGFEVSWSPAWEAHYYESLYTGTWDELDQLDPTLPLLVLGGGASDTFLPDSADIIATRLPQAEVGLVPGYGHLFPLAAPDPTRDLIEAWLARLVPERQASCGDRGRRSAVNERCRRPGPLGQKVLDSDPHVLGSAAGPEELRFERQSFGEG